MWNDDEVLLSLHSFDVTAAEGQARRLYRVMDEIDNEEIAALLPRELDCWVRIHW